MSGPSPPSRPWCARRIEEPLAGFGDEADLGVAEEALDVTELAAVVDQLDDREEDEALCQELAERELEGSAEGGGVGGLEGRDVGFCPFEHQLARLLEGGGF